MGIGKVPHGHANDEAICSFEACNQLLDASPNFLLGLVHRLLVNSFVFCADGFLVELRQFLIPDVQRVYNNLRTNLTERFKKGWGRRQVSSEILREVLWINEEEPIGSLNQRPAAVGKFLAIPSFSFTHIRCMSSDKNQRCDLRISTCLRDDGAAIAVSNQDGRTVLLIEDPAGSGHIFLQRSKRFLN